MSLKLGKNDSLLVLVFSLAVGIANLTRFVRAKEEDLAQSFVGVGIGWERGCVGDLEGYEAFPLWLEGRYVDNDSASRIC